MKYFKFAPLSLAVAALLAAAPVATTQAASQGDLEIYKGGLPLGESGSNSGQQGLPSGNAALLMLDMSSIDGDISLREFNKRKEKMRKTIAYLMKPESEGGLSDDTLVGLGAYPSTTIANKNLSGDGRTAGIFVPAGRLGPAESELTPEQWKKSQRKKIIDYVEQMGSTLTLSPMASAYAEAGAYMMGTTTSRLTKDLSSSETLDEYPDTQILTRELREKEGVWEYCPPANRQLYVYENKDANNGKVLQAQARMECPEAEGGKGWIEINKNNVAPWNWNSRKGGGRLVITEESDDDLEPEKAAGLASHNPPLNKYDIFWDERKQEPWPWVEFTRKRVKISPVTLNVRDYHFKEDTAFKNRKAIGSASDDRSWGSPDGKKYYYDATAEAESILTPVLRYRKYRTRFNWREFKRKWQYCAYDKAELVNYIYSSYRLMCNEEDWVTITSSNVDNYPGAYWGNTRPAGIDGFFTGRDGENKAYYYDAIRNPYNGWSYYNQAGFLGDQFSLPPTLNIYYSTSGIRNSPPEIRGFQKYTYDQPNYRICKPNDKITGSNKYQSNPNNRATTEVAVVQNAAIFFITGGMPSSATLPPTNEMNKSLGMNYQERDRIASEGVLKESSTPSKFACDTSGLSNGTSISHWGCMGAYSRRLNSSINPTTRAIKTGVFLVSPLDIKVEEDSCVVTGNTSILSGIDANRKNSFKNACLLGSSEYGDGGFHLTNTNTDGASVEKFAQAIKEQLEALNDETIQFGMIPSGPIEVPANSLRPGELMDYGYLPLAAPNPGSGKSQWVGNLRKYKASNQGYVGQNNVGPFSGRTDTGAAAAILAGMTKDYWSANTVRSIDQAGGAFERIPVANKGDSASARKVYVSSFTVDSSSSTDGELLKRVSPTLNTATSINNVKVFSGSTATLDSKDVLLQRLLLNYMGYKIKDYDPTSTDATAMAELEAKILNSADSTKPNKMMGAVVHSTPVSFVAKATIDAATGEYTPTKEYVLFGAMDNALHVVDNATGEEVFSYFPKEVLTEKGQYKGITPEKTGTSDDNTPSFGVDGPWAVYTSYVTKNSGIEAEKTLAYGGARLGAQAYYGLNLTNIDQPRQLFTIAKSDSGVFNRLGYTWAKPVVTKIRWQGRPKLVVVLSGGYDREYDKTDQQRLTTTTTSTGTSTSYTDKETLGNAIYIVDAETGKPLIVASNKGASVGDASANNIDGKMVSKDTAGDPIPVLNSNMKYSIPGGVKVLDRDADELTDHIYFADLNGQVFRMDIDNQASKPAVTTTPTKAATNPKVRVGRIANLNGKTNAPGPRLYEAPTVTIQTSPRGQRFATVSVASGDRSNPLSKNMSNHVDAVYTLYDKDVAQVGLFKNGYSLASTITATTPNKSLGVQSLNGVAVTYSPNGVISATSSSAYDTYEGWMVALTEYGEATTVANTAVQKDSIKAMGPLAAIANKLYVSAYNPDDGLINTQNACLPEVLGTTEIHQYCLPYGVCVATSGSNNQYQRFRAGKGIMIPSFGTDFDGSTENAMSRSLIGQNTQTNVFNKLNSSAPDAKASFSFKGLLNPLMWFDMQSKTADK